MSLDYRILSFLLMAFLLPTLINSSPHPQRPKRHGHRRPPQTLGANPPRIATTPNDDIQNAVVDTGNGDSEVEDETTNTPIINTGGTGNGKRGLAYNSSSPSLQVFANSQITWVHNWNSIPEDSLPSDFLYVPTLWGDKPPHSDDWQSRAEGYEYLMSFNEPDIVAQANMQVNEALDAYKRLMVPLRKAGVKIGAPSVSSGNGVNEVGVPYGVWWLGEFLGGCGDGGGCVA
ncbi:MAG: hypothetical protein Q9221_006700 [Calogaya cf. arnoldii]